MLYFGGGVGEKPMEELIKALEKYLRKKKSEGVSEPTLIIPMSIIEAQSIRVEFDRYQFVPIDKLIESLKQNEERKPKLIPVQDRPLKNVETFEEVAKGIREIAAEDPEFDECIVGKARERLGLPPPNEK